jgi:hypothetical protein
MILTTLALLAATPTAEAERLGVEVAKTGTLATLLPILAKKEAEEMVTDHAELSDAEKAELRSTAMRVADAKGAVLLQLTGKAYAKRLSEDQMRAVIAFEASAAGRAYRAAIPGAIVETMQGAGQLDFKKDVLAAFCTKTGEACPKP